jgi:hypothetical protein
VLLPHLVAAAALAVILYAFVASASASAEIRFGSASDPQDATPTISGVPNQPDLSNVEVTYDTAGSFSIKVSFYNAFNAIDTSKNYAFAGKFDIGSRCNVGAFGGISGQHHIYSSSGTRFLNEASVSGFDGTLPLTTQVSPDQKSVTVSGSAPGLANLDLRCFSYYDPGRIRSTVESPTSSYDSGCDCWYASAIFDFLGGEFSNNIFYFDGFGPPPPRLAKTKFSLRPLPICGGVDVSSWRLLPNRVHGQKRSFDGQFVYDIQGPGPDMVKRSRVENIIKLHGLRRGHYTLKAQYVGDSNRTDSKQLTKYIKVDC